MKTHTTTLAIAAPMRGTAQKSTPASAPSKVKTIKPRSLTATFATAIILTIFALGSAQAANIASGVVTNVLWPGGVPYTFTNSASTGGGDSGAQTSANFDRSFGTLNVGPLGTSIVIRGIAWASLASGVTATNVTTTITYLGADGVSGGGDDVVIGTATDNVTASAGASTWAWAFTTPITNTIIGSSNIFRISISRIGTGSINYKTTSGTALSAVKLSAAGTTTALAPVNPNLRTWSGSINGTWNTTDANWTNGAGAAATYADGNEVAFSDALNSGALRTNITLSATMSPASMAVSSALYNYSFSGSAIAGTNALTKSGAGALTLNMANTYTGGSTLSGGAVRLGNANGLGTGTITLNGGTLSSDGATARTVTNAVAFSGSATLGDTVNNGTVTLSGPMDFAGGGRDIAVNSPVIFSGTTTNGGLNQKTGTGTLTYAGVTGEVGVGSGQCQIEGGDFVISGGNITKNNGGIRIGNISANGISRMIITNGAQVFMTGGGLNLRVGNDQAPAANASSTNILDISGTLAWTTNSGGIVVMGSSGAFSQINLRSGGLLKVSRFLQGVSVTELNLLGGTLGATVDTTIYLTNLTAVNISSALGAIIDTDTNSISIAQALVDPLASGGGLTKTGAGVLTLTGASTYTGRTTVSNGTLVVNGSIGSSARVISGAILSGKGTIGGSVTNNSGGTVSPSGTFPATLTVNGNFSQSGTGSFRILGSSSSCDKVSGVSTFTSGGTLNVTLDSGTITGGETYQIVSASSYGGTAPAAGTLPALSAGQNWYLGKLPVDGTINVNRAPTGGSGCATGVGLADAVTITLASIKGKHALTDADAADVANLAIVAVGGSPTRGSASFTGTGVTYTSDGTSSGADSFTYVVSDLRGGTVTNTINVTVNAGGNGANITSLSGTVPNITVNFAGLPSSTYAIERATSPSGPWSQIAASVSTAANGQASYLDTSAPSPSGFYRTQYVSTP